MEKMEKKDYLRKLSSVNDLIQAVYRDRIMGKGMPRELVTEASRTVLDGVREAILAAKDELSLEEISTDTDELVSMVEKEVEERLKPSFRRVINATGVVVHTNLMQPWRQWPRPARTTIIWSSNWRMAPADRVNFTCASCSASSPAPNRPWWSTTTPRLYSWP
jgi:hypothetical protein